MMPRREKPRGDALIPPHHHHHHGSIHSLLAPRLPSVTKGVSPSLSCPSLALTSPPRPVLVRSAECLIYGQFHPKFSGLEQFKIIYK
ncbi:hypothetical protein E2C01_027412 [Portunus trituberculatus]|uniref:Uncharacterized protein n=1 Tax=Portunus trituberculatus TaxID=210409 RepID=A0A5B7ELJ9_PORTR|nr:hypothetical protein [Portunus trituberculatus]